MKYVLKKDEDMFIDQDGVSHESPAQWLWSIMGGCGCGSSDEFADRAVKVLKLFGEEFVIVQTILSVGDS